MCDQFRQFVKLQKKSVEPLSFCRTHIIGGISWNYMYNVDEVDCKENQDGSVQLDVMYDASKTKWIRHGLGFFRVPQQSHAVITTDKNFEENWTLEIKSPDAAVFHNCSNGRNKCFMFIATVKG